MVDDWGEERESLVEEMRFSTCPSSFLWNTWVASHFCQEMCCTVCSLKLALSVKCQKLIKRGEYLTLKDRVMVNCCHIASTLCVFIWLFVDTEGNIFVGKQKIEQVLNVWKQNDATCQVNKCVTLCDVWKSNTWEQKMWKKIYDRGLW